MRFMISTAFVLFGSSALTAALPACDPACSNGSKARNAPVTRTGIRNETTCGTPEVIPSSAQAKVLQSQPNTNFGCSSRGILSRSNGQPTDTEQYVSFHINQNFSGKQCQLEFTNAIEVTGSGQIQVFKFPQGSSFTCENAIYGPPRPRDLEAARFKAVTNGKADTVYGNSKFDCPAQGSTLYYELVPQGDNDYVSWDTATGGGLRLLAGV